MRVQFWPSLYRRACGASAGAVRGTGGSAHRAASPGLGSNVVGSSALRSDGHYEASCSPKVWRNSATSCAGLPSVLLYALGRIQGEDVRACAFQMVEPLEEAAASRQGRRVFLRDRRQSKGRQALSRTYMRAMDNGECRGG